MGEGGGREGTGCSETVTREACREVGRRKKLEKLWLSIHHSLSVMVTQCIHQQAQK